MLGSMPDLDYLSIETDGGEKYGEFVRRNLAILGKDRIVCPKFIAIHLNFCY